MHPGRLMTQGRSARRAGYGFSRAHSIRMLPVTFPPLLAPNSGFYPLGER